MKKVDVSFVCDRCQSPLPTRYVSRNQSGEKYFDLRSYNSIKPGNMREISFTIAECIQYNGTTSEFCPKCRIALLREILSVLEERE